MSADLEVDWDALRHGGEQLTHAADRFGQAWATFTMQVQSMGDIFGDDAVGGLIGASYEAAHQIADECYTSVAEAFDEFGELLSEFADNHEENEREIADQFHRMMW